MREEERKEGGGPEAESTILQVSTWSRVWHTSFLAEPGCLG